MPRTLRLAATLTGLIAIGLGLFACPPTYFNNTATLGGNTPGARGEVQISFVNNTPFRAIFTYGVYDQQDQFSVPQIGQFVVDPDPANGGQGRLEGNSTSEPLVFTCGRTIAVGTEHFINRVLATDASIGADEQALQPGIAFSDKPLDDPQAGEPTAGMDEDGIAVLQGWEFECGRAANPNIPNDSDNVSLVIITFEVDPTQPDGFRIDFEVVLP